MKMYVIITSWYDKLYKMEAWSDNYYLISMYYRQYNKSQPLSLLKEYETGSILEFANKLKMLYDASIDDIVNNRIHLITSKDNKLCAIYKYKYEESFTNINESLLRDNINYFIKTFLSVSSIIKYLYDDYNILLMLIFVCYQYRLKKDSVDLVYLWFFLLKTEYTNSINTLDSLIPYDTVFVRVDEY